MEFHFTSKLEEYYQKFVELQEKLKKSEEQRFVLETKFNEMGQVAKEEEQAHYRKLRAQYKRFLEEDKKRQNRNEHIIRNLERIETRISMLSAKTERINILRRQYQNFLLRVTNPKRELPNSGISRERSFIREEPLQEQQSALFSDDSSLKPKSSKDTFDLKKPLFKKTTLEKDQSNEEKIEILDRYLQSVSSQRCRDLLSQEREAREKLELGTRPDIYAKDESPITNHATAIADDIMNSIYSRYYNKVDSSPKNSKLPYTDLGPTLQQPSKINDGDLGKYSSSFRNDENTLEKPVLQNSQITRMENTKTIFEDIPICKENTAKIVDDVKEPEHNGVVEQKEPIQNVQELAKRAEETTDQNSVSHQIKLENDNVPAQSHEHSLDQFNIQAKVQSQIQEESIKEHPQHQYVDKQDYKQDEIYHHQEDSIHNQLQQENTNNQEEYINQNPINSQGNVQYDQHEQPVDYENVPHIPYQQEQDNLVSTDHRVDPEHSPYVQPNDQNQSQLQHPQFAEGEPTSQFDQTYVQPTDQNQSPLQQPQFTDSKPTLQFDQSYVQPTDQTQSPLQQPQYTENEPTLQYDQSNVPTQGSAEFEQHPEHIQDQPQVLFDNQSYDQNVHYNPTDASYNQQYDENGQLIQYDQNGQPIKYDPTQPMAGYDQYGQPLMYDQLGQIVQPQYDEHGQIVPQYDENGQLIMLYDQNGQPFIGDQQQYDENGQPIYSEAQQDYGYDPSQYGQYQEGDQEYYVEPPPPPPNEIAEKVDDVIEKDAIKSEAIKQNEDDDDEEKKEPTKVANVMDILDTDAESSKQNTSKISNDTDFDFS